MSIGKYTWALTFEYRLGNAFRLLTFENLFDTKNIMCVTDPVKWPPGMSVEFKSFLKGLLNKDPQRRYEFSKAS